MASSRPIEQITACATLDRPQQLLLVAEHGQHQDGRIRRAPALLVDQGQPGAIRQAKVHDQHIDHALGQMRPCLGQCAGLHDHVQAGFGAQPIDQRLACMWLVLDHCDPGHWVFPWP
jgi:hypothetical protein